jgi:succinate dehydrogenase/fumarate reductase flavoprotein subunit
MESGVRVFNRTMAVEILKEGERVAGAVGLNIRTGEQLICRCPAVILSAGGTARFGLPNNGYLYGVYDFPGNTGDGYCLGYRAGAKLSGFEYTIVYYIIKDINAPLLYITVTRGARVLDFQNKDVPDAHLSIKGMLEHHMKNRGPLRIRMVHLPEEKIAEIEGILFTTERPVMERFFQGRGINFRSGDIELWPTECYLCGGHGLTGIMVNDRAETAVPGLYAAGDTSLVARGHLSGAFIFGQIAAESATAYARAAGSPCVDFNQIQGAINSRISSLTQKGNGQVPIEEFEYKVRRHINDYITPPKNEYKLKQALWWMDRFENELKAGLVRIKSNHDLFKALELENIILSARLAATASIERRETRWVPWHFRSDYPEKGGDAWLKHIVLTMGEAPADVKVSHQEIQRMELPDTSGF